MSITRRLTAAAAATLGALALVAAPLASRARAQEPPLLVYSMKGAGRGAEIQFTPKPSTLDPTVDLGLIFVRSAADSAGGGGATALASDVYPGDVVNGGAGCGGVPGTTEASYPPTACKRQSKDAPGVMFPQDGSGPLVLDAGHMRVGTALAHSHSKATANHLTFAPATGTKLVIDHIVSTAESLLGSAGATQITTVKTQGIRIETSSFTLDIGQMISRAVTSSNGSAGDSDATLTIADAVATFGGESHRVTIDNKGVHLVDANGPSTPPEAPLPTDVREPLGQHLQEAIAQAKLEINTGSSVEITDGPEAEASVGGLVVALRTGRPPAVPIPPIISIPQIPNQCGPPSLPLCVGQGVLPFPPGDFASSISFGGVDSIAVASGGFVAPPCTTCTGGGGNFGGGLTFPPAGGSTGGGSVITPPTVGGPPTQQQPTIRGPLLGLVAKLPSGALAGAGAALVVFAIGLAAAPSLRSS